MSSAHSVLFMSVQRVVYVVQKYIVNNKVIMVILQIRALSLSLVKFQSHGLTLWFDIISTIICIESVYSPLGQTKVIFCDLKLFPGQLKTQKICSLSTNQTDSFSPLFIWPNSTLKEPSFLLHSTSFSNSFSQLNLKKTWFELSIELFNSGHAGIGRDGAEEEKDFKSWFSMCQDAASFRDTNDYT